METYFCLGLQHFGLDQDVWPDRPLFFTIGDSVIRRLRGKYVVFVYLFEIIQSFENHREVFVETWTHICISFHYRHLNIIAVRKQNISALG